MKSVAVFLILGLVLVIQAWYTIFDPLFRRQDIAVHSTVLPVDPSAGVKFQAYEDGDGTVTLRLREEPNGTRLVMYRENTPEAALSHPGASVNRWLYQRSMAFHWINEKNGYHLRYETGLFADGDSLNQRSYWTVLTRNRSDYWLYHYTTGDEGDLSLSADSLFLYSHPLFDAVMEPGFTIDNRKLARVEFTAALDTPFSVRRDNGMTTLMIDNQIWELFPEHPVDRSHLESERMRRLCLEISDSLGFSLSPEMLSYWVTHSLRAAGFRIWESRRSDYDRFPGFLPGNVRAVTDLDGDGVGEILIHIAGSRWINDRLLCARLGKEAGLVWETVLPSFLDDIRVVDLDGDGELEIIGSCTYTGLGPEPEIPVEQQIISHHTNIFVLRADGTPFLGESGYHVYSLPLPAVSCRFLHLPDSNEFLVAPSMEDGTQSLPFLILDPVKGSLEPVSGGEKNGESPRVTNCIGLMMLDHKITAFDSGETEVRSICWNDGLDGDVTIRVISPLPADAVVPWNREGEDLLVFSPLRIHRISTELLLSKPYRVIPGAYRIFPERFVLSDRIAHPDPNWVIGSGNPFPGAGVLSNQYNVEAEFDLQIISQFRPFAFLWYVLLFLEVIVLFIYLRIWQLSTLPIRSGTKSYVFLTSVLGLVHFWSLKGSVTRVYPLVQRFSFDRTVFDRILMDISRKPELVTRKNFLLIRFEVYEIESHLDFAIIQSFAHDLKNRLLRYGVALDAFEDYLIEQGMYRKVTGFLDRIKDHFKEMATQMINLANFAHIGKLFLVEVDLVEIVREILTNMDNHPSYSRTQMQYLMKDSCIEGDRDLLKMAVRNLIENAMEAIETEEEGTVKIELTDRPETVQMKITNPGEISDIDLAGRVGYSSKHEGTGLGIPIAVRIMESHRGTVKIHSDHHLVTVVVRLPRSTGNERKAHESKDHPS